MDVITVAQDFMRLGARPWAASVAAQVYMDLCEVKRLADVRYSYEKSLDVIYLLGKNLNSDELPSVYIPLLSFAVISGNWISKVLNTIYHCKKSKRVTVAIREEDTTIVYYTLTDGLVSPESPEERKKKKNIGERTKSHDFIICKRKRELFQRALNLAKRKKKRPHSEEVKVPEQSHENESVVTDTYTVESDEESETDVTTISDQPTFKEMENVPRNGGDKEMATSSMATSEQTGAEHEKKHKDKKEPFSFDEDKNNDIVELEKEHADEEQEPIKLDKN